MVSKSFTFMALTLCALSTQTFAAKVITKADKTDSEGNGENVISGVGGLVDDEDDAKDLSDAQNSENEQTTEYDYDYVYPSLSCRLFKNIGCKSQCSVVGSAFGYKATGTCDEYDICDCAIEGQAEQSLDSLWNAKFDSKQILQLIKKKNFSEEIRDILKEPFQTAQEIKIKLQPYLSQNQLKKLKVKKLETVAEKMRKEKLYSTAMKTYITNKLAKTLKTADSKTLYDVKYKSILPQELKKADDESKKNQDSNVFNELVYDVLRTRNKSLDDILTSYLKDNKLNAPDGEENEPTVADIIASNVIDELVKKIDEKTPTAVQKSDDADEDHTDTSDVLEEGRFLLPNMQKAVFKQPGPINRTFNRSTHKLRYQKSWGGDINVFWAKGKDEVKLQKTAATSCNHTWKFGDVTITISKSTGGDVNEFWNFGDSTYKYSKGSGGDIHSEWSGDKPHTKMLRKYQKFIDAWCHDNDFLLENRYCIIYNN